MSANVLPDDAALRPGFWLRKAFVSDACFSREPLPKPHSSWRGKAFALKPLYDDVNVPRTSLRWASMKLDGLRPNSPQAATMSSPNRGCHRRCA